MAAQGELRTRILDAVLQPVWVVDVDGDILFANPASVAALGYDTADELEGKPSHATVHYKRPDGSPYPVDECPMLAPRITGVDGHGEDESFVRRDGSMFPIAWWSAPIGLVQGQGAVFTFIDITERRLADQARRDLFAAEIRADELRAAQRRIVESTTRVRRQIARDIHDGAQQRLVTVLIGLQLLREQIPESLDNAVKEIIAHTLAGIDDLRRLATGMHPAILTSRGLVAAVQSLADQAPIPTTLNSSITRPLEQSLEANAYFLVAEAMTNAVKHAHASRVTVTVQSDGNTVHVAVEDDGIGGAMADGTGSGLSGMRDRVSALDGTFTVDSPRGGGTRVRAVLPVRPG